MYSTIDIQILLVSVNDIYNKLYHFKNKILFNINNIKQITKYIKYRLLFIII